jgi:hypothetical protein
MSFGGRMVSAAIGDAQPTARIRQDGWVKAGAIVSQIGVKVAADPCYGALAVTAAALQQEGETER